MSKLDKLKTLIPMELIESGAQQQIYNILDLECLKKLVVLPDIHMGYFMPIGGVALLDDYISPEMVGYDIGCGVCYIDTGTQVSDIFNTQSSKTHMFNDICKKIPMGVGVEHKKQQDYNVKFISASGDKDLTKNVSYKAEIQLGTLGSGNHFIEIGETKAKTIAITIHSGSRNPGHQIASYYMNKGQLLDINSSIGVAYHTDMLYAQKYALENRKQMMTVILDLLGFTLQSKSKLMKSLVNENHNHANITPDGILHRKGATPADKDQIGIIPGNMRDGVVVTKGLGNKEYLSSSSHGAGRVMSRTKAKKNINYQEFKNSMNGIIANTSKSVLDESPKAYKRLNDVIAAQEGKTIEIVDIVKPIINIKV